MDMNDKAGQPSMEEILASIRRIIAEEPAEPVPAEMGAALASRAAEISLEEGGDFELPSMFRPNQANGSERATPGGGRLSDALKNASPFGEGSPSAKAPAKEAEPGTGFAQAAPAQASVKPQDAASNAALSSLKPVRTDAAPVAPAAFPEPPAPSKTDVRRVMAPFKDTRFSMMSAPTGLVTPPPPSSAPAAVDVAQAAPVMVPRAEPSPALQAPVVAPPVAPGPLSPPPLAQPPRAAAAPAPAADPAAGSGSIEDTTAELLRPMLRQWLSENMPRMVEKALHIEVAESVKIGKKPDLF